MRNAGHLLNRIAKEPYRIFFPLAALWGILGVSHWLFYAIGWIPYYSGFLHSSIQIQAYLGCFVLGFLLTAIPRFSGSFPATPAELIIFVLLASANPIFHLTGHPLGGELCFAGWLLLLLSFGIRRFLNKQGTVRPPVEFVWIPIAFFHGLAGIFLLTGAQTHWLAPQVLRLGKILADHGFMLSIVIGVGGFLGPRLMGTQTTFAVNPGNPGTSLLLRKKELGMQLAGGLLLFSSFILEGMSHLRSAYALRLGIITVLWVRNGALNLRPRNEDAYVWPLWISFWMIFLGHAGLWIHPLYRVAVLHLILVGGYSLMTYAVGTMVVLSHAGQAELLRKPIRSLHMIAMTLGGALSFRIGSEFFPGAYFRILGIASSLWLFSDLAWVSFILPYLFRFPDAAEFERCHEEAKERVLGKNKPGIQNSD